MVFVRDHQSPDLTGEDTFDESLETTFLVVKTRSNVLDHLIGLAIRSGERLQECSLAGEIILLFRC